MNFLCVLSALCGEDLVSVTLTSLRNSAYKFPITYEGMIHARDFGRTARKLLHRPHL